VHAALLHGSAKLSAGYIIQVWCETVCNHQPTCEWKVRIMLKLRHTPAWLQKPAAWLKKLAHAAEVEASTKAGQEPPAGMELPSMSREFVS